VLRRMHQFELAEASMPPHTASVVPRVGIVSITNKTMPSISAARCPLGGITRKHLDLGEPKGIIGHTSYA
jgi:hypothetical protein